LPRLVARLREDRAAMARPVLDDVDTDPVLAERVAQWQTWRAWRISVSMCALSAAACGRAYRAHGN